MKSYIINLKRRFDRLNSFLDTFPKDWPYESPIIYNAVAGSYCNPPAWWTSGGGAWGCYRSHLNIIEQELNQENKQNIIIFEDDAIFCENFITELQRFLPLVPNDADQIYLGGQHLKPPIDKGDYCLANNINRTHCYIVTPKGLQVLYKHLNDTKNWPAKMHIDHHYGSAHLKKTIIAYTPKTWLVGQNEDIKSDVCGKSVKVRWWKPGKIEPRPMPDNSDRDDSIFVVVLGLHRSGSSCTAMILHKLGINMGDNLGGYENRNGGGGEAQRLAQICEQAATFPATEIKWSKELLQKKLKDWISERISKAKSSNTIAGGKYPHLCAFGDELINILGDKLRVIHCDRPLDESIDSLKRRSKQCKGWLNISDEQAENVQTWLWNNKNSFLSKLKRDTILNINYQNLLIKPQEEINKIITFLDINPTDKQKQNAIDHVKK